MINNQAKVSPFIPSSKKGVLDNLSGILPDHIMNSIKSIPIPIANMTDIMI